MTNKTATRVLYAAIAFAYLLGFMTIGFLNLLWLSVILAFSVGAALLVARHIPLPDESVTLAGVDAEYALRSAAHALWVVDDDKFGFPSGSFIVSAGEQPGELIAREYQPETAGGDLLKAMFLIPWRLAGVIVIAATAISDSVLVFMVGQALRVMLAFMGVTCFGIPLLLAWLLEVALKPLVASVITVTTESVEDGATLHFRLRGVSAYFVRSQLRASFAEPKLPKRFAQAAISA